MRGLDGQVAFLTGGGGGIGKAVANRLAAEGAAVFVTDVRLDDAEKAVEGIRRTGGNAVAWELDVTDPLAVERAAAAATEQLGTVGLGVACAGIISIARWQDLDAEGWDRTMAVNLKGTFLVLAELAKRLTAAGRGGSFVGVSSTSGRVGRPDCIDYAASKAGVISLTRSLSVALAPSIRVNAVCPGVVDTPMTTALHTARSRLAGITFGESLANSLATIPLGRVEAPEDVADVIAFLLSDDARYVTGQALNVCGGVVQS